MVVKLPDGEYCIYLRKSRADLEAEARGKEETLESHKRHLLALAKKLNLSVTKIYSEVVSGDRIAERPEMQKLLQDVEAGMWEGVLVMEIERLARGDTMDQGIVAQTFKYSDTKIITPVKTYDPNNEFDEEYFEFGLFMSRREYKTINRRQQRGRLDAVRDGRYPANQPPYGYNRVKLKGKGYTLEPHPEQAPIVKMIFDLYVNEGLGSALIARRLNELNIPTAKNKEWTISTIRGIIRNPHYIGKVRWNWRAVKKKRVDGVIVQSRPVAPESEWIVVDGLHEPIIDEETWNKAQEIMNGRKVVPAPPNTLTNPLAGLIRCGMCGRAMVRRPYDNRPAAIICPFPHCSNVSTSFEIVEQELLKGLRLWHRQYKAEWGKRRKKEPSDSIQIKEKLVKNAEKNLNELIAQKGNLHDLLEKQIYTTEVYLERSQILSARIKEAEQALEKAVQELELEKKRIKAKNVVIPLLESVLDSYFKTDDAEDKNRLLKSVLDYAVYTKEKKGHWRRPESIYEFELQLYPKLP